VAPPASLAVRRLRPGDVAVIQHVDLDRSSAEALIDCQVAAVVNAGESISGRYPTLGPEVLVSRISALMADGTRRGEMRDAMLRWARPDADERIAALVVEAAA